MAIKYTVFGNSTCEKKASRLYIIIEGRVYKSMIFGGINSCPLRGGGFKRY